MYTDPSGEAWWHWAIAAGVVVACAALTVVTCGGFAGAVLAVGAVASGVAAGSAAATVAAGAFIASSVALGTAAMCASIESDSVDEFFDQGNWFTVGATAFSAGIGCCDGYMMSRAQKLANTSANINISRGSTGRTEPADLREQFAMEQVKSNPYAGIELKKYQ